MPTETIIANRIKMTTKAMIPPLLEGHFKYFVVAGEYGTFEKPENAQHRKSFGM